MEPIETMDAAKAFITANAEACADDLLTWKETGLLPDGKMREAAGILKALHAFDHLSIAEGLIVKEALKIAANGGGITMSIAPTSVWIIAAKDREGNPRGIEKAFQGRFWMVPEEAKSTLDSLTPSIADGLIVTEVVVMGRPEFDRDYNPEN